MNGRDDWLEPAWDAPPGVHALFTLRNGGVSTGPFGGVDGHAGMNLGRSSGDDPGAVAANRARLRQRLPSEPRWLAQEHGATVVDAAQVGEAPPRADASVASDAGVVCAVLVADCLPVLLADVRGRGVAAAHAGWRGLAAGVLQATVNSLREQLQDPAAQIVAWLGPAIGPQRFEVGGEVLAAMNERLPDAAIAFQPCSPAKYLADLPALARQALAQVGVARIAGGHWCTVSDAARFYSFRRDGRSGRHAAVIWRD